MYLNKTATSVVPIHLVVCTSLPLSSAQPLGSYPINNTYISNVNKKCTSVVNESCLEKQTLPSTV